MDSDNRVFLDVTKPATVKHEKVYTALRKSIVSGELKPGNPIPTQKELSSRFNVSRPTIGKALEMLEDHGLLSRRNGGTPYVRRNVLTGTNSSKKNLSIFIIHSEDIPDSLEHSIFGAVVSKIASIASEHGCSVSFETSIKGQTRKAIDKAALSAKRMVQNNIEGVFYLPTEL
jgi:LacI family transcriptional regulator